MGELAKKILGSDEPPEPSAAEENLARLQADRLKEQEQEKARRKGALGQTSRRQLLSGGERGVG